MTVTALTPKPEPSLFALLYQAAVTEQQAQEAHERTHRADQEAHNSAEAARSADHDAECAFGEFTPDAEAWRGYPDRTALASLGAGYWLRWSQERYPHSGRHGDLTLIGPCPHNGYHEREIFTLTDLPDRVAEAARCNGGPLAACYPEAHYPDDF